MCSVEVYSLHIEVCRSTFFFPGVSGQTNWIFNTGPYGDPPLEIKILKIGLRHVLSWPKLGLEPKFHEPGTFGGFGKREQTNTQDSCFISINIQFVRERV